MRDFRTYQLAVKFHKAVKQIKLPGYLKDQMLRASSSIALNLAEGSGRYTKRDQVKFYQIALGSLRECQAVLDLEGPDNMEVYELADELGGCIYKLIKG